MKVKTNVIILNFDFGKCNVKYWHLGVKIQRLKKFSIVHFHCSLHQEVIAQRALDRQENCQQLLLVSYHYTQTYKELSSLFQVFCQENQAKQETAGFLEATGRKPRRSGLGVLRDPTQTSLRFVLLTKRLEQVRSSFTICYLFALPCMCKTYLTVPYIG